MRTKGYGTACYVPTIAKQPKHWNTTLWLFGQNQPARVCEMLKLHAAGAVAHDLLDDLGGHLLELVDELGGAVFVGLYVAQFLLPLAGELDALEELFMYDADEGYACGRGFEAFAHLADVLSLEEGLYDGGARGGAADAVGLEGVAQLFVVYGLAGGLHGAEERGFGVGLGGRGLLLGQRGLVGAALPFLEVGQGLLVVFLAVVVGGGRLPAEDGAPALFKYLLAAGLELSYEFGVLSFEFLGRVSFTLNS